VPITQTTNHSYMFRLLFIAIIRENPQAKTTHNWTVLKKNY